MITLLLSLIAVITTVCVLFFIFKKDFSLEENFKYKKLSMALLALNLLLLLVIAKSVNLKPITYDPQAQASLIKIKTELEDKNKQLLGLEEKVKVLNTEMLNAKAESELHTSNVMKLQEEILRKNDEFTLLKEELDLRYKVDANKILRENEEKIRKSASLEAQKLLEDEKRKVHIKVAKDNIESKIVSKWTPPKDQHNLIVVVKYDIDPTGKPTNISYVQRSGNEEVDKSVVNAIVNAAPLPLSDDTAIRSATTQLVSKFVLP